jgi:hypothetical protein
VAFGVVLLRLRRPGFLPVVLVASILTGAFLFCLVLKWMPYHARLHVPLFILSAPIVALLFQRGLFRFLLAPVVLLFAWTTWPYVFYYPSRPALGDTSVFSTSLETRQYESYLPLRTLYPQVIQILAQQRVHELGFISDTNEWEYPISAYGHFHHLWRTDQVLIQNCYAGLETTRVPDALVNTLPGGEDETLVVHGRIYRKIFAGSNPETKQLLVSVYLPISTSGPFR